MVTGGAGSSVVWDTKDWSTVLTVKHDEEAVWAGLVGRDKLAVVLRQSSKLHVWDIGSGELVGTPKVWEGMPNSNLVRFGDTLAFGVNRDEHPLHLVELSAAMNAPSTIPNAALFAVNDISKVDFTQGPNGEKLYVERCNAQGHAQYQLYFYRTATGEKVKHGPYTQFFDDARKKDEAVYVHGTG